MQPQPLAKWTHFTVAHDLPGSAWGTGGIGLADLTGKGHPEIVVCRRETQTAYWFERVDDATWVRQELGTSSRLSNTLGAAVLDIDGDGWLDIAFNGVWFRNPGTLALHPDTRWEARAYDGGGHDVVAADINGSGRLDLLTYDGHVLAWFDTTRDLAKTTIAEDRDDHGGIAPHGVGDLNGNGHLDVVVPGTWFENPGGGLREWRPHPWPHLGVDKASYGTSMRSWVVDLNNSGWNDIVYSDCDTGWGHVYWVENLGQGERWVRHPLPDPPGDPRTGSFPSLGVADLDSDGILEVFAGGQEDSDTICSRRACWP